MPSIKSDMAGTVVEVLVKPGDQVSQGQEVALVESMKMEVPLVSQLEGKVSQVVKHTGDFVNEGEALIELE